MSLTLPARRRRTAVVGLASTAIVGLVMAATGSASAGSDPTAGAERTTVGGAYVVQLAEEPVATYSGGTAGMRATAPAEGARIDSSSPDTKKYAGYLKSRHDAVLARVRGAKKLYDYTYTFNGFAAQLTGKQAATLRATPGVVSVTRDEIRQLDTVTTPRFLGLTGPNGAWQKQFGGPAKAGDKVIVGIVDSGLWPENPSFAALPPSASDGAVARRFKGSCDPGLEAPSFTCNNKVIGGRWYARGIGVDTIIREEYLSPRDHGGHGSHTASTAAGNHDVPVTVEGVDLGRASGMAPAARISVYKVCWDTESGGGCATSDSVAAIDQAVADGVDVINYSISGSRVSTVDPVELAFFRAAQAGVFVAASAGNSGPGPSTVAHNDPWLTTVAAGTHDRQATATITLGNGKTYTGAGLGAAVPSSPVVLSTDAKKADAAANDARLCLPGSLDPAKATGKIVVCDRGVNARPEKSKEVKDAGGVGMILTNTAPSSLNADLHSVPTVHVDEKAGAEIKAYVQAGAGAGTATASFSKGEVVVGAKAPQVAAFSSRGPALAGSGDLLKPDIMAPGVDVLAAVAPPGNSGRDHDFYSGTSMSSPHIAGLGALVVGKHPRWSPTAVKSALMTTATTRDNKGQPITTDTGGTAGPLDYGAGQVVPSKSFDPGLVYDSRARDWVRYLCGTGELPADGEDCKNAGGAIDPSDLNMPSIAIGALPGVQTVTRTVTNVSNRTATYVASVQEPNGVDVTVRPSRFVIEPGKKKTFKVTITRNSAAFGTYVSGALTWNDGRHQVRSPIVVRPVPLAAPVEVDGTGTDGSVTVPVTAGFTGTLRSSVAGLVPATVDTALATPSNEAFDPANPKESSRTKKFTVTVAEGTRLARFATFDADYAAGSDLDVFVYRGGTATLVGQSAGGTSEEIVDLVRPAAGTYDVYVDLFSAAPLEVKLNSFVLGSTPAGNATAEPASQSVTQGTSVNVTVAWTGLAADRRWLGAVLFSDDSGEIGSTLVSVDS